MTPCPHCKRNQRRAPGLNCLKCEAAAKRRRRAAKRERGGQIPKFSRSLSARRYIITSAQNATPVHREFLKTLEVAAAHLGAELVVIPLRYKNPTSVWTNNQEQDERWAEELAPYLFNQRKKLGPNLVLAADVKMQPTASSPLTGFESLTGAESCILGHPKMQFRTVPVPSGRFPKILTTTGSVTVRNYTDTKAGKIGSFHHYLGALVVELKGKRFWLRQINADRADGSFTDLDQHYTVDGVTPAPRALGLVTGDTHARFTCPKVDRATFGPGGIVETLDPETLVFHDVVDGDTVNPHHVGDPFASAAKSAAGSGSVEAEVRHVVDFVTTRAKGRNAVIVESNHHDFLARWIKAADWKTVAPVNRKFYLDTAAAMLVSTKMTPHGFEHADPFAHWVKEFGVGSNIRMLRADESFTIADIECGMHGHRGPNGARGSLKNLSRLGAKTITGHSHTPGIEEGGYAVGTSTPLRLEYTRGPSSWLNSHVVIYASGKRALITIIEGEWRA